MSALRDDQFILTGAALSGVAQVRDWLCEIPEVLCHGHVFSITYAEDLEGKYASDHLTEEERKTLKTSKTSHPADYLLRYVFDPQSHRKTGFLFAYDDLLSPRFSELRDVLRRNADLKIIHLARANLFDRLVELKREQHGSDRPLQLTSSECEEDFTVIQARFHFVRKLFRHHPVLEVTFEDADCAAQIAGFLGFDCDEDGLVEGRKDRSQPSEMVTNYAELKAHFSQTSYAHFFEAA